MQNVLVRLSEYRKQASSTEKEIIKFILENPKETSTMTVYQLAKKTYSSPASVIRMCNKNGFKGYRDFIKSLIYELAKKTENKQIYKDDILKTDGIAEIVEKITYRNIFSLEDTKDIIDFNVLNKSVELIKNADNICLFGLGASLTVAKDAQQKFMRLNKNCTLSEDWHLQLLTARNMSKKDIGLIISYSGRTKEMIECAVTMKNSGIGTISITGYGNSPIVDLCDYNLYVAARESTFRSGAISSRISQLNIIDILYTAYANINYEESLELIQKTYIKK
jgi:DNA-binding MurR/RpiR family transcriptional regulator